MRTLGKTLIFCALFAAAWSVIAQQKRFSSYTVLNPITEANLTVYPVTASLLHDTHFFLTLDEGVRSGQVVIAEEGNSPRMVRPLNGDWAPPRQPRQGAEVNRLTLSNNSERPLLLLAGEIVTGGRQDRVIGKDRIVPANSGPIDLDVFCVEPHRWMGASARFDVKGFVMAQPSVRKEAMAAKDQSSVWDQVAKSRQAIAGAMPAAAPMIAQSSSYAGAMQNRFVEDKVNAMTQPVRQSFEKLLSQLHAQHAVGAVVAVNGQLLWADVFASPALFEAYWPKLVRSYAAEALAADNDRGPMKPYFPPAGLAQKFLDDLNAQHETVESEPGLYKETELQGEDFQAFILTSLLPGAGYEVHIAKMRID